MLAYHVSVGEVVSIVNDFVGCLLLGVVHSQMLDGFETGNFLLASMDQLEVESLTQMQVQPQEQYSGQGTQLQ